jgi:pimeloyl-ACP methyl ester carboxylesterase
MSLDSTGTTTPCKEHASLPRYESRWAFSLPPPINTSDIEADGGKWVQLADGRIVEYFICGSTSPDATVLLDCHGGNCSGKFFSSIPEWLEKCEKDQLNLKVISLSQPGFGYSTILPERKIADWPMMDVLPILKMENVNEFLVTGISFGTCHAMAVASTFAPSNVNDKHDDLPKCLGMGLRAPYLGSDSCKRLDLDNHLNIGFTSKSANTTFIGHMIASAFLSTQEKPSSTFDEPGFMLKTLIRCLNPGLLENLERLKKDYSDLMERTAIAMDRSVIHSTIGCMYNYSTETLLDHGFDIDSIRKDLPVVIWYAKDDEDCPPTHGEYLSSGKHFVKCTESSTHVFEGYGHVGCAFVDHPQFLEDLVSTTHS